MTNKIIKIIKRKQKVCYLKQLSGFDLQYDFVSMSALIFDIADQSV